MVYQQEFINNNPNLDKFEIKIDIGNAVFMTFDEVEKTDTSGVFPYFYVEEKSGFITWLSNGKRKTFDCYFNSKMDTLTKVTKSSILSLPFSFTSAITLLFTTLC